mgnify:CR=1 FL=1
MKKPLFQAIIALGAFLCGVSLVVMIDIKVNTPVNSMVLDGDSSEFTIKKGARVKDVTEALFYREIISDPWAIDLHAKTAGLTKLKAGTYSVESTDTALSLLEKFNRGEVIQYQITFVEGWSFNQWVRHLSSIEQFEETNKEALLKRLKLSGIAGENENKITGHEGGLLNLFRIALL